MTGNKAQVGMIKQVKLMRARQTVIKEGKEQKQKVKLQQDMRNLQSRTGSNQKE